MATLAAWWAAEVDAAGPVRVVTTVIGLLCAIVWVHRAQVDRWIQTHFDRAFHVDTGAVAPHIAAARHNKSIFVAEQFEAAPAAAASGEAGARCDRGSWRRGAGRQSPGY